MSNQKNKSVAIVAMGDSHFDYTHATAINNGKIADEVWAINAMAQAISHDRVIMIDDIPELLKRVPSYKWAKTHDKPIITSKAYSEYPMSEDYPIEEVINHVGFDYFNTTVAYAIGLAMYEGFKTLKLFGCDYTYPDRHIAESGRACVEYLLATAVSRGISIEIAPNSTLMDTSSGRRLYGYAKTPTVEIVDGVAKVTKG